MAIAIGRYGAEVAVIATNATVFQGRHSACQEIGNGYRYANLALGRQRFSWSVSESFKSMQIGAMSLDRTRNEAIDAINSKILYGGDRGDYC